MNLANMRDVSNCSRSLLWRLIRGQDLSHREAAGLLNDLFDITATDVQIAATLVALTAKGETVEELAGMASAMRARATHITARHDRFIDTAGTGSSSVKTFNVSTAAAFVIAGAGLPVAKHGNGAATSRSGSADVLRALGINVTVTPEVSEACLNEIGICFMYAPLYHGSAARVASVRREMGVPTTFNLLGPLTNPAGAPFQVIGVWHASLVKPIARALVALGTQRAWVVHGIDGLDELTVAGKTVVAEANYGNIRTFETEPESFGLETSSLDHLRGGNAETNARIIRAVLNGERHDEARSLIVINAAAALLVGEVAADPLEAARMAERSIDSGAANDKLNQLAEMTKR
jgi:anthranilate phosphoribosyltransferase